MQKQKPTLASTLDYYGVSYSPTRNSQKILCPVRDERVPSCSVNLDEGVYNCHGCGSHGDSLTLIQEREHVEFAAALVIAEEILASGGKPVSRADDSGDPGLFGRTRSGSRSGRRAPYRPRLYSDGRP